MGTLRDYQAESVQSVLDYFFSGKRGNPLVVAPTGSGKSWMIAGFCSEVKRRWKDQRILVVSHSREILSQNYSTMKIMNPGVEIGLYSAGLKSKTVKSITIAGIQSIYNKPELFDEFNIIIVDEAHTIPFKKGGMYRKFFDQVKVSVIGYTATPYRLGRGYLHLGPEAFFDDIVYTITIKFLQDKGYLCQVTSKGTQNKLDASEIKKQGGDYILKELSLAFDRKQITKNIVDELLVYKDLRRKWLLFAIDIEHAENIAAELNSRGVKTGCVHSKIALDRDTVIEDFRDPWGYQALVSVAVLTTGFDVAEVDLIGLLRPTQSPTLHVQIIGRGLRPHPDKEDCLVLDFAGNLITNGPIDAPIIRLKGEGTGEAIMKECPNCYEIVHAAVRVCPSCKHKFEFRHKLSTKIEDRSVLTIKEWHEVTDVKYYNYTGSKGIPMLKVSYFCTLRRFNEYVCLDHPGKVKYIAQWWWKRRSKITPPNSVIEAMEHTESLKWPSKILVEEEGQYPSIIEHEF